MNDDHFDGNPLVAFDFDGTLTVRDSFMAFLRWRVSKAAWYAGMIRLIPAALGYVIYRSRGRIKAAAVRVFLKGLPRAELEREAKAFAEYIAPTFFRPDALVVWRRWRARKAKLVIVTASPDILVAPFARGLGADVLIGTELAFDDQDRVAGGFSGANCRGPEKVRRLKAMFGDEMVLRAAYGDTAGDKEMLSIAEESGYQIFKGGSP